MANIQIEEKAMKMINSAINTNRSAKSTPTFSKLTRAKSTKQTPSTQKMPKIRWEKRLSRLLDQIDSTRPNSAYAAEHHALSEMLMMFEAGTPELTSDNVLNDLRDIKNTVPATCVTGKFTASALSLFEEYRNSLGV